MQLIKYAFIIMSFFTLINCSKGYQPKDLVDNASAAAAIGQIANSNTFNPYTYVWVEPDIGEEPLLYLINHASQRIDIVMYELADEKIQSALLSAAKRGVIISIIYSNRTKYESLEQKFCAADKLISCRRSSGPNEHFKEFTDTSFGFAMTHEKALVIDNKQAVIMTGNMVNYGPINYFANHRDFIVVTNNSKDVKSLNNEFKVDWDNSASNGSLFPTVVPGSRVFFSPSDSINETANSYNIISGLINQAVKSIDIFADNFSDTRIEKLLNNKAKSGVKVRIIAVKINKDNFNSAVQIVQPPADYPVYFHAKSIIVDNKIATVMSVNYSYYSMNKNREAGIVLTDAGNVAILENTFIHDWKYLHDNRQ